MHKSKSRLVVLLCVALFVCVMGLPTGVLKIALVGAQSSINKKPIADRSKPDKDDPRARLEAQRESRGKVLTEHVQGLMREAKRQRDEQPERFSKTSKQEKDVPRWRSIGPTSATREENYVDLNAVDSGRLRNMLVSPDDPDTVYVLSAGGGLWKAANFSNAHIRWQP